MKKSGRISAAAAVMGELMGVRPIIALIDGKTKVEAKVRGDEKVVPAMVDLCQKRAGDVEDFDYMIGHTNIPQAAELEKGLQEGLWQAAAGRVLSWAACGLCQHRSRHRSADIYRPPQRVKTFGMAAAAFGHIQRNHYLKFRNTGASADAPVFHFYMNTPRAARRASFNRPPHSIFRF